jgi:sterol desaturase/sphingolipid hydroxylase (fatty acid hydroxylase superfamily)
MSEHWLPYVGFVRLLAVVTVLLLLIGLESWRPRRGDIPLPRRRWRNIELAALSTLLVRLMIPVTLVAFAAQITALGSGILGWITLPAAVEWTIAIVALDLAIYWQHRLMHRFPMLWRIHRVHHSDLRFDATLGLRFHPLEILLSTLYKIAVIALLAPAPQAVALYEILLTTFSLLTHADVAIPESWDRQLRQVLITPDWHRVHHSIHRNETDSNYGNLLTLWDRLFSSHIEQPVDGHRRMAIGLPKFRDAQDQTLRALLLNPFTDATRPSPIDDK